MSDLIKRLRETYPETYAFTDMKHIGHEAADMLTAANERIRVLEASLIKAKGIPMKYKRMEFNAQLQDENSSLRTALAAEREVSNKLGAALAQVAYEFYQYTEGFTILWAEIDAALAEVAALRKKDRG